MINIEEFKKVELRIAQVKEVNEHPNADKLLVLTLDAGEKTKQVVAGIKSAYNKDNLVGKFVVLVDNLEPALLRGVESQGMVLAGSDDTGVVIISPEKPLKPGSIVK